jgi:hypothetical protein
LYWYNINHSYSQGNPNAVGGLLTLHNSSSNISSIKPFDDCCVLFAPKAPVTKANIKYLNKEETRLNEDELIENALLKTKVIKIRREKVEELSLEEYFSSRKKTS